MCPTPIYVGYRITAYVVLQHVCFKTKGFVLIKTEKEKNLGYHSHYDI